MSQRIADLIDMVGLTPHIDKRVASFSSGMRQRLAIVRGLLSDPEILILDEPTRTLDPIAAEEHVDFLIDRIHSSFNKTLIVATHKLEEAARLCDRYCIIDKGVLIAHTDAKSLQQRSESLERFYRTAVA